MDYERNEIPWIVGYLLDALGMSCMRDVNFLCLCVFLGIFDQFYCINGHSGPQGLLCLRGDWLKLIKQCLDG